MKLLEFVKYTDFKKYYFCLSVDDAKRKNLKTLHIELKLKDGSMAMGDFELGDKYETQGYKWYDLGQVLGCQNAESTARNIDACKQLKVYRIEHWEDTAYIHLDITK